MRTDHFAYITSDSSPGQTKVSSDRLELLGRIAAKHYLEDRVPLNSSIKKMAQENDLNSNQIERICETANISTHKGLWSKTAEKENVVFKLADASSISGKSGCGGCHDECGCSAKTVSSPASTDSDYAGPPRGIPTPGPSLLSMMGADPAQVHDGLGPLPEKKKIVIVLQKKAAERSNLKSELLFKGMELETLEKKAYQSIKQAVLGGSSFSRIFSAAVNSGLAKVANERLCEFQDRLIQETHGEIRTRLVKCAIQKAPEDLISSNLGNMLVVNGAHPVLVSLDQLQRKTGEVKNGVRGILRIDDEIKTYQQRLRELA